MNTAHPDDDRLIAMAMGELEREEEEEEAQVESHLAACPTCRGTVAALAGAIESVRGSPEPDAPAGVLIDLLEAQAAARRRPAAHSWRLGPVPAAAIVLVIVIFVAAFWAGRHSAPAVRSIEPVDDRSTVGSTPLPEPPRIPFQTAVALDRT